jgi:hypothetical protein
LIRNTLVKSLYEKLQGPEFGPEEEVEFPFSKYVVGILSTSFIPDDITAMTDPVGLNDPGFSSANGIKNKRGIYRSIRNNESSESDDDDSFHESSLDPRLGSKSMGLSFSTSSKSGTAKLTICCTWARYELKNGYDRYEYGLYNRVPNYYVTEEIEISDSEDESFNLFSETSFEKKLVTREGPILHIHKKKNDSNDGSYTVSIFLENKTKFSLKNDKREHEEHRLFQPQIRVKCSTGTKINFLDDIIPPKPDTIESRDSLAYLERTSKARGHQCGAIWNDIDPERESTEFSKCMWTETFNEKFPATFKTKFYAPDVRTDYFPSYTILQPNLTGKPEFDAEKLANMWSAEELEKELETIPSKYKDWILKCENDLKTINLSPNLLKTAETNLKLCEKSLLKINQGIEFVCNNERAKLAFCFMNKVMSKKMQWDNRDDPKFPGLKWREFQMAFILQSLRGVAGIDKDESKICEVLWFPTGGGKTESYLGLSVFAIGFRRLTKFDNYENDGGTTILSRYTLRLLTIQQFTRASGSILAADLLRVQNWSPSENFKDIDLQELYDAGNLWGNSRISLGLWIGGGITPNTFPYFKSRTSNVVTLQAVGSLERQKTIDSVSNQINDTSGEPAQLATCPCCKNILATHSLKKNIKTTITWLVKTSKTIQELNKIGDEKFNSSNSFIKISDTQFTSSKNTFSSSEPYVLFQANVTILNDKPDEEIDKWWRDVVKEKISNAESDPIASTSASRPGYFFIRNSNGNPFDYSIHCTNFINCELNIKTKWFERHIKNILTTVASPFQDPNDPHFSTSVPISAFTVDTQVYSKCPTFVLATVDKFARMPFDHRCSGIFGNVDVFHNQYGYGRDERDGVPRKEMFHTPLDTDSKQAHKLRDSEFTKVLPFSPPNLIIQDELHLIEGPLGSMVGIYEMAVDLLCSNEMQSPKYIASSATVKESASQVASVYRKKINVFPASGISSTSNYFTELDDDISSVQDTPGRLYLGICAGIGVYNIPVKIWAVLLSEIFKICENPEKDEYGLVEKFEREKDTLKEKGIDTFQKFVESETDLYGTLVGFFSDLQLLARTSNFYLDDIYRDVKSFSPQVLENIDSRGFGEIKSKGIRFYKIIPNETFTASTISIFCQGDPDAKGSGKISVAIFNDKDGKPENLIRECSDEYSTIICTGGENIVDLKESFELKAGLPIWICLMNEDNSCNFQTGENIDDCYFSISYVQKTIDGKTKDVLGDFTTASSTITLTQELPIRFKLKSQFRVLDFEKKIEMSSQTPATELPGILDRLDTTPNTVDSLLTTPIFGTGIDINRLGLMVVMNQPKTTSQYIQATGRVGRSGPGLVVSWLKSGRYRDLNHFENFVGYHRTIHRFVEPITASPFSDKTMRTYLGPVIVAALRNGISFNQNLVPASWVPRINGNAILQNKTNSEVDSIFNLMKNIACSKDIPGIRRMDEDDFEEFFDKAILLWENAAKNASKEKDDLEYYDYSFMYRDEVKHNVVLGTPAHKIQKKKIAFNDTRTSLREVESQTAFGEKLY